eukprot:6622657-Pyramimonas_sp.AAC.1
MIASWWTCWVRRRLVPMMGARLRRAAAGAASFRPTGPLAAWLTGAGCPRGGRVGDQMARGPDPATGSPANSVAARRWCREGPACPALPDC